MEAIIPIKIRVPTLRMEIPEKANTEAIAKDLNIANELHEAAAVCMASYPQIIKNLYNRRVKQHAFRARDLVLRRVFENTVDLAADKYQPNWEGQYTIVKLGAAGSYALDKLDGTPVPMMWNAMHLKRHY